jgi:tRNA nucleotidyltransferase (CCA-adding enzyme)
VEKTKKDSCQRSKERTEKPTGMDADEPSARWEHFPHDADMGIRGIGHTKAEAFEQAALALTAVTIDPDRIHPHQETTFSCEAPDDELLFVDWLNALVFEMDTHKMAFTRFHVMLNNHQVKATAWGEPFDPLRHEPAAEVKGATYTELSVHQLPNGFWIAQCVVDV